MEGRMRYFAVLLFLFTACSEPEPEIAIIDVLSVIQEQYMYETQGSVHFTAWMIQKGTLSVPLDIEPGRFDLIIITDDGHQLTVPVVAQTRKGSTK